MNKWTALAVEDRMIAAESTLRRLPEETLRGSQSTSPDVERDSFKAYGCVNPARILRIHQHINFLVIGCAAPILRPPESRLRDLHHIGLRVLT